MPIVSVTIINYNTQETTLETAKRVKQSIGVDMELIIIDNASREFDAAPFEALGARVIRNGENLGFAKAANQGLKTSHGDYLMLLNSDAFVETDTISSMVAYLEKNPRAGVVGPKMRYPDGRNQVSSGFFPTFLRSLVTYSTLYKYLPHSMFLYAGNSFHKVFFTEPSVVDWISGGAMMFRREAFRAVGLLDERFFFGGEDLDCCYRLKQTGWDIVFHPGIVVVHCHGHSSGNVRSIFSLQKQGEGLIAFMKKDFPDRVAARLLIALVLKMKLILTRKGLLR